MPPNNHKNFPVDGIFFAIVRNETIVVPGDQRSKDMPGHGYPKHFEDKASIEWFSDEAEFKARVLELTYPESFGTRKEFRAFRMQPITVNPKVDVEIKG